MVVGLGFHLILVDIQLQVDRVMLFEADHGSSTSNELSLPCVHLAFSVWATLVFKHRHVELCGASMDGVGASFY